MLKVLGRDTSINVRKVLWALDEIGIPFEREDWGIGYRSAKEPDYLKLNPNGLIPTVIDGDRVMWESNPIVRYYAAIYQHPMLPADPLARFEAERWMDWQATDLTNAWRYAFHGLSRKNPAMQEPDKIAKSVAEWTRMSGILEARLEQTGAHVAGDDFTVGDICIGLAVNRWMGTPIQDRPAFPAIAAYYKRLSARPAFRKWGPDGAP